MGARGVNIFEEAHVLEIIPPGSISGGASAQIFSMKNAAKCNIVLTLGALAAAEGAVQLFACTTLQGANPIAFGFDLYQQTTAGPGNDLFGPRQSITAAGFTPPDTPNVISGIHFQADELPQGYPYVLLTIADGTNADYASATVVLTGYRYGQLGGPSATV